MLRKIKLWDTDGQDSRSGDTYAHIVSQSDMIQTMYEELLRLRAHCQAQEERLLNLESQSQLGWRGVSWPSVRHPVHFEIDP